MMRIRVPFLLMFVSLLLPGPVEPAERDLDRWFDRELIPFVQEQLTEHPRFKGETVMFVVLENNAPAPIGNALTLSLRDRLLNATTGKSGISIGWLQGRPGSASGTDTLDCTRDDVHYYIGISVSERLDGSHGATVRALDLEDRSWVPGFGLSWQGRLTTIQRRALRQSRNDETFLGARDVPFAAEQTDLLATQLAHKLTCALLRETSGSYVVAADRTQASDDAIGATVELVSNNLANHDALELTTDDSRVNAVMSGKAHQIDGSLYQYWLTVTPHDVEDELSTLSTSAYLILPADLTPAGEPLRADAVSIPDAGSGAFLGPLRIDQEGDRDTHFSACHAGATVRRASYSARDRRCSLLRADTHADAIVFFLAHQANHGLVRLSGPDCRSRTAARVAVENGTVRFPIPFTPLGTGQARETHDWLVAPGLDTYYAIAVRDTRAARRLANHIDRLPMRCSLSIRPGLDGAALNRWLDELASLAAQSENHIDWRAIEVKDVL